MKAGANYTDQNRIKTLGETINEATGYSFTASEISIKLGIEVGVVENFLPAPPVPEQMEIEEE